MYITGVYMNHVSLKKIFILSLSLQSFSIYATSFATNEALAKQCQDLSETVASLVSSQAKTTCAEKLGLASSGIEKAGYLILDYANSTARHELDTAVYSLKFAELNSCKRYIEISHSKFEAQRIKNSL